MHNDICITTFLIIIDVHSLEPTRFERKTYTNYALRYYNNHPNNPNATAISLFNAETRGILAFISVLLIYYSLNNILRYILLAGYPSAVGLILVI